MVLLGLIFVCICVNFGSMKNRQLIFIDDSGDPGFKLNRGSSKYFVIVAILFENEFSAERASLALRQFKKSLGWTEKREFKHNKSSNELKSKFFDILKTLDFKASIKIVDKIKIKDSRLINSPSLFYNDTILNAIEPFFKKTSSIKIYVDGESGNNYRRNVRTYLRKNITNGEIDKLIYRDSNAEILIQLADMVAGVVRKIAEGDIESRFIFNKIKKKTVLRSSSGGTPSIQ